ncbi:hypothetical protein D3C76_1876190 [compost metagenome]
MLAQLVVQGLAWQAESLGEAAHGVVRTGHFSGDQRALEGFHLLVEVGTADGLAGQVGSIVQVEIEP